MSLSDLYQDIILDHYKNPRNYGEIDNPDVYAEDNNPSCGDEIEIHLKLDESGDRIDEIKFSGQGCAISMASGSLMSDRLEGKSLEEVEELRDKFKSMITSDDDEQDFREELGDLVSLKGVIKFPIRIKCANLSWDTLEKGLEALREEGPPVRVIQND